jgi:hypothetical protein
LKEAKAKGLALKFDPAAEDAVMEVRALHRHATSIHGQREMDAGAAVSGYPLCEPGSLRCAALSAVVLKKRKPYEAR